MTATFQGVNIDLHGFLDFARAENENPTGPDIQIVLGRPLDIALRILYPVYVVTNSEFCARARPAGACSFWTQKLNRGALES